MKKLQKAISMCLGVYSGKVKKPEYSFRAWDKETPYGIHPLWCAMTFLQETDLPSRIYKEREIYALALIFHDLKEDTTMELPDWLPQKVQSLVDLMTFTAEVGSTLIETKEIWKRPSIVRLLKLYDKVSNLLDGIWMSNEKWNDQYVPYVLQLADDVEENFGKLNITRIARAIAVLRS